MCTEKCKHGSGRGSLEKDLPSRHLASGLPEPLHSRSRLPGGTFTVHAKLSRGDHVWVEVEDGGGPWTPRPSDPARAHGLDIVRTLASDCGIDGDHHARTVWARFDWPDSQEAGR